jgi:peptide/nickel transport system permease protein
MRNTGEMMMTEAIEAKLDQVRRDEEDTRRPSDLTVVLRKLKRRPPALFGLAVLALTMVMAMVPGLFAPLDPIDQDLMRFMKPPGYVDDTGRTYWLGTDEQGRDILSRIIWGSRISMIVGVATVLASGMIGVTIGIIAATVSFGVVVLVSRRGRSLTASSRRALVWKVVAGFLVGLATWSRWYALGLAPVAAVLGLGLLTVPIVMVLAPLVSGRHLERVTAPVLAGSSFVVGGALVLFLRG